VIASRAATDGGRASALCFSGVGCFLRVDPGVRLLTAPVFLCIAVRVRSGTGTSTGFVGIRIGSVDALTGGGGLVTGIGVVLCLRSCFTVFPVLLRPIRF